MVTALLVAGYSGVGVYTWWRRPRSRLGPLVAIGGFLYALTALVASTESWRFTVGRLALAVLVVFIAYLFLCFPRDRLGSKLERRFMLAFASASAVAWALVLALVPTLPHGGAFSDCSRDCPKNAFQLVDTSHAVTRALNLTTNIITAAALAAVIVLLVRKARSPAHLRRRAVVPLLAAATALLATYAAYSVLTEAGATRHLEALRLLSGAAALAVPLHSCSLEAQCKRWVLTLG